MMKNISKILAIAFVAMVFGISAKAQTSASATGTASAVIQQGISIAAGATQLNFGTIVPDDAATGTVTINPAGVRSNTVVTVIGATYSSGLFSVAGEAAKTFDITLPSDGDVTLTNGATGSMDVSGFNADVASGTLGTLDASGDQDFTVGATLEVGIDQEAGNYTGSYQVSVNYN